MTGATAAASIAGPALAAPAAPAVAEYDGWWQVPPGLLTRAQLAELEFPRQPTQVAGRVWMDDFRGRRVRLLVDLYRPQTCLPTTASAAQLRAAAARATGRVYECAKCGCRPERSLAGEPLCQVCRHIQRLRGQQEEARRAQRHAAECVAEALAEPRAVILHAVRNGAPPTPSGRARPPLSARIRAVDAANGRALLDVTVSLVSPRARLRDPNAVPAADVTEEVIAVLGGRTLIYWSDDTWVLRQAVRHDWPQREYAHQGPRLVAVQNWSTSWRAQLTTKGERIPAWHPGTPDRLWLHLTRIAATVTAPAETNDPRGPGPTVGEVPE
ncbi:hypothetical protein [Asanoa siamensis]|uniref:Uncharacterized protein n=1 Tax=Asanoa siamensis TaxID=926357 RepID=A0ABQ4CXT8_9ACTN|nr:hypothetical protein [Asanoa siamensis]GIF75652.1 hypothetical protein Asi02nite_51700 [Asanoa siamensis]